MLCRRHGKKLLAFEEGHNGDIWTKKGDVSRYTDVRGSSSALENLQEKSRNGPERNRRRRHKDGNGQRNHLVAPKTRTKKRFRRDIP